MTALGRTPQNTNLLQPTKYILVFDRISTTQYFCQSLNIPGISLGEVTTNTPLMDLHSPGTKLSYNEFNINFIVDEQLESWKQLYNWFQSIASPQGFDERNRLTELQNQYTPNTRFKNFSDSTLTILSALNNPIMRVNFINMFPFSLSDITFDTAQSADDIITASASFRYEYFEFVT
jgi:hypothetical protein